jgi:hypothetical protein
MGYGEAPEQNKKGKVMNRRLHITGVLSILCVLLGAGFATPLIHAQLPLSGKPRVYQRASAQATNTFTGTATAPLSITFTPTGALAGERHSHTATLLQNGKVLIVGGIQPSPGYRGPTGSAELYDPATGMFTATGSLNQPRVSHAAVLLPSGKVLVAGGLAPPPDNPNFAPLASVELYDPATGVFTTMGSLKEARADFTATPLPDGKVLVVGGGLSPYPYDGSLSVELYDPGTGMSTPLGNLLRSRQGHSATLLPDGKVLIAGGEKADIGITRRSAELYDPATGTSTLVGDMNGAHSGHTGILLPNGKVLVVGGEQFRTFNSPPPAPAELYDPATRSFTVVPSSLDNIYRVVSPLANHKVVVFAAPSTSDTAYRLPLPPQVFDPATETFTTSATLQFARRSENYTATLLQNGKVLIAGGYAYDNSPAQADLATEAPANTFTGSLTLPSGRLTTRTVSITLRGTASGAPVDAGALSNDGVTWGDWISLTAGEAMTTWDAGSDGANKPVYLRLRDVNGQVATVVRGTVNIDTTPPANNIYLPLLTR